MKTKLFQFLLMFILIYITTACSPDKSLIQYNKSLEYVYLYEIDTFAKIRANDSLRPGSLKFKSEIKLNRLTDCDYVLRFDRIQHDLETGSYATPIKRVLSSPFKFKLIDGEVKQLKFDFNLKDQKIDQWIRTLYENLFSTLQLPLGADVEQDEEVGLSNQENFDQCPTVYKVKTKRANFYEIRSSKKMANCLKPKNKFINKLLINSAQDCVHLVRDGRLIEVDCQESNRANVLTVVQVINSKLKFLKVLSVEPEDPKNVDPTNDQLIDHTSDENLVDSSKRLLVEICEQLQVQIDPKITRPVLELARQVRKLDYNQLVEVAEYSKEIACSDKQQFKDILHSVIFQQGSAPAIQYLLERVDVDEPIDLFYSLLAFSQTPTENAVRLIIPRLVDRLNKIDSSSYQPVLGITSFLGNYCDQSDCEQNEQIIQTQQALIGRLGKNCSNKQHQILLLKCIQNVGLLGQMTDQVLPCLDQKSTAVRLATLQLLDRAKTVNQRAIDQLKLLFSNQNEESELRINAFLILIKAVNFDLDSELRSYLINQLKDEQNLQVLAFISSYLKNLKNDSLKELENQINVGPKTENVFLFSKNIFLSPEFLRNSLFDGELDINLIRNSKNQLVNGNLRAKIAADQKQTVEFGFIQTGLSDLVDKFIAEIYKKSANVQAVLQELLNQFVSLQKDKEGIETLMNRLVQEKADQHKPARLVTYLNVNRKTIFLVDFNNEDVQKNPAKPFSKSKRSIQLNKSILSQAYERALVLLYLNIGKELSNPLSPIRVELVGVAVLGLKFNNQTLAPTLLNEISTSIEIGSKQEHKLMLQSSLNLSPVLNYEIQPVNKDYVFNLYMPNNTIPLVRSTTFLGEHSAQEKLISEAVSRSVCTGSLTNLIGVELCLGESRSLDKPIQKLVLHEIYLKKTDLSFKSWQTIFTFEKSKNSHDNSHLHDVVVLFDTPGSVKNRHFNSKIQLRKSATHISLNGTFSNQIQRYSANLDINMRDYNNVQSKLLLYSNDQQILTMDFLQIIRHDREGNSEYAPSLRIFLTPFSSKPSIFLGGHFVMTKDGFNFVLSNKPTGQVYLKGKIAHATDEKHITEIYFNLPDLITVNSTGSITYSNRQHLFTDLKIEYELPRRNLKDSIQINTRLVNASYNTITKIETEHKLRCTKYSNFNFILSYNLTYQPSSILKNEFAFKYLNIKEVNLFQSYSFTQLNPNSKWFKFSNMAKVSLQPQQLTYQSHVALVYHPAPELFQYKLDFNLDKINSQLQNDIAKFDFDYQQVSKRPLKTYLKSSLRFKNQLDLSYKDELDEVAKNEYKGQTMLKWSKNKFIRVDYNYVTRNHIVGKFYKLDTDFQMHHMPNPFTHQAVFEYQKNNFTVKSLFKIKDREFWNLNLFHEYRKLFNLSLESEYLNIRNQIKLQPSIAGTLLIDGKKFVYFDHSTQFNYTNMSLFELSSLTNSKKATEKTNIRLIDRLNDKLKNKMLANLTINRKLTQLKLNLQSFLVSSVKLSYNDRSDTNTGQFELVDRDFQQKSSWTYNNNLHLKMKLVRLGQAIGNLSFLAENGYNDCDLKASYYDWNLNSKINFKNEGRKLVFVNLNQLGSNGQLLLDHTTNISAAVTNGYIKSQTFRDGINKVDFDASIQGRDSSRVSLLVKDVLQFSLVFNPFIKNKFADLEINDISDQSASRKYLVARFEYLPRSFELTTNYFNEKLTYKRTGEQSAIQMDFENLNFFGKSGHLLILHQNFTQYSLKQYEQQEDQGSSTREAALKPTKEIDLKFVSKREFYLNFDFENLFSIKSDVDLARSLVHLNLRKQPFQIEFKIEANSVLLIDYHNEHIRKQLKLFIESNGEYQLLNYVHRRLMENYDHETKIRLFSNYDLDARLKTVDRYLFEMRYELWQKFELTYKKPNKEVKVNLIKDRNYLVQLSEKSELYKLEFKEEDKKVVTLFARSVEFAHESELTYGDRTNSRLLELTSSHSLLTGSKAERALNLSLRINKSKESQLLVHHYQHRLDLKIDPFVQKKIQAIYWDEASKLLSCTEFAYLGPQTYHLYSNVTATESNKMPFQFALIAVKKKPTQFNLTKDDWRLAGEFNFLKLSKQTGLIKIRNDLQKLYGNITLEANHKSFLIANYILRDSQANIKGRANLTLAAMSEIVKFDYKDESRTILTQLFWLGDRMMLNSEVNHTDYTHKISGLLKYDPSKTVRLSLNKTYNSDTTMRSDLTASLSRTSNLCVEQINFGNLNVSVNLVDKQNQKIDLNYLNNDQTAAFFYTKQNQEINSNLAVNLQKLHPLLLLNSSFNLVDGQSVRPSSSAGRLMKSTFNFDLLEPEYKSKINSECSFDEDTISFSLTTDSLPQLLPTISSNLSLSGLSNKYYLLNSNWLVNQHRLTSIYRHREYLNAEYGEEHLGYYYQAKFVRKSNADEPLSAESFVKRVVDGKATVLNFDLNKSKNDLNTAIGLEYLKRKTTFAFTKLDDQIAQKRTLIFETIFDSEQSKKKVYDLRFVRINNDSLKKRTVTLNSPYLSAPLLADFEKKQNHLLLKWNLLENQPDNQLKIDFKGLHLTEVYKVIKTIVSYNDKEIVGLDLEKNPNQSDLTRLNVNFFNSTVKLEDNHERLIFNLNDKDLTLKVDKEYRIHLESQFKADKLSEKINQKIVLYYDVQKKAVSYQDFELESLRTLSTQLLVKPVPLTSTYISILNTKDEINNEIFLLQINTTDLNKRKFLLKHNGIYLFSRQFVKRQKKIIGELWSEVLLNTRNQKFSIKTYMGGEVFASFYKYSQQLRDDLSQSFRPIIRDWPLVNNFIVSLNKNFLDNFLLRLGTFVEDLSVRCRQKYNDFLEEFELWKEYSIEMMNIIFERFDDKYVRLRKLAFRSYNWIRSSADRQINLLRSYVPENYWNLLSNLWSILCSSEFWQSRFPVITNQLLSFYF